MNLTVDDSIILTIAKKLIGKQADTKTIIDSLEIIASYFGFDNSAIYEMDQLNQYNLKEHVGFQKNDFCESFPLSVIKDSFRKILIEEKQVYYCNRGNHELTDTICELFQSEAMVLYPVLDNTEQILGFIIFFNHEKKILFDNETIEIFHVVISILEKYIGRRMYENKVAFSVSSLESILDNTGIDIYVNDFYNHDILYVNKSMAAPYGGSKEFMGHKCWQVLFPGQNGPCEFCPQKKLVDENGDMTKVYTWDYQRAFDGSWFRVFSVAFRWIDGRLAHVVSSADITDNKKYEGIIYHMANYDALTSLPNRRMLVDECKKRIDNATTTENGYLLFFDIDDFKAINDNYGHDAGDDFLVQLATFFNEIPMLKDSIYRNGGDEFVAIIGGEGITKTNIRNLARFIQQRFTRAWNLKKADVYCGVSIGVACYPEDGNEVEVLLHKADQAMYKVKKQGGRNVCFGYEL